MMKGNWFIGIVAGLVLTSTVVCAAEQGPRADGETLDAKIKIDAARKVGTINPWIYGQFLEHINNSTDLGLYAEMLQERSFETTGAEGAKGRGLGGSVRPGFDSNIATDNRLEPNEKENYTIFYSKDDVAAWPVTVKYKVYYLKKGGSGKFPTGADGFLSTSLDAATMKKLAIYEVYSAEETIEEGNGWRWRWGWN